MGETETVDLSALGTSDFNPYIFDRDPIWILLPLVSLLLVFLHLKEYHPLGKVTTRVIQDVPMEEENE